jgi:sialidase-1
MRFSSFIIFLVMLCPYHGNSQTYAVFTSGKEGHKSYRIPAIVTLPTGELMAFAEGRVNNSGDFGDINIVLKKSKNGGRSWSELQVLVNYDSLQAGNPAPVVDLLDPDHPQGVVYLFYNTGNNHESDLRKGKGLREVWFIKSYDKGTTWSTPVNITAETHRPMQPQINPAYTFKEDWRAYANTPGHAFQFQKGKFRSRIFVPANHSSGPPQPEGRDYSSHGFYTDDHGKSFHLAATVNVPGSNECMGTELSGDRMMMTIRNQRGDIRKRIIAYSGNGGDKWDTVYFDSTLTDPVCQGSILTLGYKKGKAIVAVCNAADSKRRDNLTVRISYDEGRNWMKSIVIDHSADARRDWTAYSDLVLVGKNKLGVIYERDNYSEIVFKPVKWK